MKRLLEILDDTGVMDLVGFVSILSVCATYVLFADWLING